MELHVTVSFRAAGEHLAIDLPGGTALFTTRRGGVSEGPYASLNLGPATDDDPERVAANRERVRAQAGAARLAQGRQVHGTRVVVDGAGGEEADGQVDRAAGRRGDRARRRLPADRARRRPAASAMLHAGWRGLAGGDRSRRACARRSGAGPVAAAIGPGAGPCCYEVGDEVHAAFGHAAGARSTSRPIAPRAPAGGRRRGDPRRRAVHDLRPSASSPTAATAASTGRQAGVAWRS